MRDENDLALKVFQFLNIRSFVRNDSAARLVRLKHQVDVLLLMIQFHSNGGQDKGRVEVAAPQIHRQWVPTTIFLRLQIEVLEFFLTFFELIQGDAQSKVIGDQ